MSMCRLLKKKSSSRFPAKDPNSRFEKSGNLTMNNQAFTDRKFSYILREQALFSSSADQRKMSFKELEIDSRDIQSFTITFTFSYTNTEEIKDDIIFFQTGPSTMKKDFIIGIHPGRIIFATFSTKKGPETLFSQISLRPNQLYYFALILAPTPLCMDVSLFINGQCESQISLFQGCEMPKGWFFLGSEQANRCFRGMVKDAIFFNPALNSSQVLELYTNRNMHHDSTQQGVLINEEQLERSLSYSKKKGVPFNVVKNVMMGDASNTALVQGNSMVTRFEDDNLFGLSSIKKIKYFTNKTREYLIENQELMEKCREIAFSFDWIFTTLWILSPTIEEAGPAFSLPFGAFQTQVVHHRFDNYPVYVIEFYRFMKVMNQLEVKLSKEEVLSLAKLTNSYKNSKSLGEIVFYNRFLISVRNASLTKEEIKIMKRANKNVEQEEEDDMFSRPLLNEIEGRVESYGKFLVQEAKVGFDCGTKLQDILTEIRPQSISIKILSEAEVFPQQEEIEFTYRRITTGELISLKFPFNNPKKEDDFTTQIKLEFEENENIIKVVMKFDIDFQIIVGISFFTSIGKTYYLPLAQTATFASLGKPTEEHVINIESEDILLGFFGNLVERKDTGRVYLGGFGVHVFKAPKENNTQEDEKEEELPLPSPEWNQGRMQILVDHCFDCSNHKTTTWHEEADFVEKFNELITKLREVFSNLEGIGNYNPPKIYENFNVSIRGVGPFHKRDEEGRILLYEKSESLKVFNEKFIELMLPVYDGICLLISSYGTSKDLEIVQENYLSKYSPFLPPKSRYFHEFPANIPDRPSKVHPENEIPPGTEMVCRNWACGKRFKFDDNPLAMEGIRCRHHPGKYEPGSIHREMNWQEALLMAKLLNYNQTQTDELRDQLIEVLVEKGNVLNAGLLYLEFGMYQQAISLLIKAGDWAHLSRIEDLSPEGPTLRKTQILPALKLAQNLKLNFLKQRKSEFKAKYDRLKKVQDEKKLMPIMMAANSELASSRDVDASSEMSFASKSSYISVTSAGGSKRKQKKPKNLAGKVIKEGSAFEEEFLIEVLKDLKLTKDQFNEINQLVQYLIYYNLIDLARTLYQEAHIYIKETNVSLKMLGQLEFEKQNENLKEIYPLNSEFKPQTKSQQEINGMFAAFSYLLD